MVAACICVFTNGSRIDVCHGLVDTLALFSERILCYVMSVVNCCVSSGHGPLSVSQSTS